MTAEQANQSAQQEMQEFQENTPLQTEVLFPDFNDHKQIAMQFYSPSSLKISAGYFVHLFNKAEGYTLRDLAIILPAMENKSMKQLDMAPLDYEVYQHKVEAVGQAWRALVEPEQVRLKRKYETMMRIGNGNGKVIPMGKS